MGIVSSHSNRPIETSTGEDELIRALIDSLQDMVFTTDREGRYTAVFGRAFHEAGLRAEDFLGRTPMEVNGEESRELHERALSILQDGKPVRYEWTQGTKVYQTSASPQIDARGRVVGIVAVRSDVTEVTSRDREARAHRRALEAAADGIVITNADGVVTWANRAVEELTGYAPNELIGQNPRVLKSGEQTDVYYRELWTTIAGGDVWRGEIVNRRKDDSLYVEAMTITPVRDGSGRIDQYVAIKHDVTEKKEALEALETSHAWWRAVLEHSTEFVSVSDADGTFRYVSPSAKEIVGFEPEELLGSNAWERIHPEDRGRIRHAFGDVAQNQPVAPAEFRIQHKDGTWRVLEARGANALEDPAVRGIIINAWDVTERVSMQTRLDEQQRLLELAGSVARMGGWSVRIGDGVAQWSDMVCDIHEVPRGTHPTVEAAIEHYAPEHRDRILEVFDRALSEGVPYDEVLQIITARGRHVWVRTTGVPFHDDAGNIVGVHGAFQDVDARKKAEELAADLELQLRTALDSVRDAFVIVDTRDRVEFANLAALDISERDANHMVGTSLRDAFPKIVRNLPYHALHGDEDQRASSGTVTYEPELQRWFEVRSDPVHDGTAIVLRDVTARQEMLQHLREQEARLENSLRNRQALVNALPANIAVLDADGMIVDVNEQWRIYGRNNGLPYLASGVGHNYLKICDAATGSGAADAAAVADGIRSVLHGSASEFHREYACHSPSHKQWFRVAVNAITLNNTQQAGAVVMHIDITERKIAEIELARLAFEDRLTASLSRTGFIRALTNQIEDLGWPEAGVLASMDLNEFRDINDLHGYETGDRLLGAVAARLRDVAGNEGLVGRTGGDSFLLFLRNAHRLEGSTLSEALDRLFDTSFELDDLSIRISALVGTTRLGPVRRSVEELIRETDVALYAGADANDGRVFAYSAELDQKAREHSELVRELRNAVRLDEFTLHMQPKVELDSGQLVAGEALIRWQHPTRGLVSPGVFIPAAEQSRLIVPIGIWVLREACRALRRWQDDGLDIVRIAVNVSVEQFTAGRFPQDVQKALTDFGVDPSGLTLEITESVFVQESDKLQEDLDTLHGMGVRLALDDFGKGFSSLGYLNRYAFDEIKIDREFIQDIHHSAYSRKVVETIVGIAATIGAETIAEGIEAREQADTLLELGCRIGQGYFYSVPLDQEDFRWLLERRSPLPLRTSP